MDYPKIKQLLLNDIYNLYKNQETYFDKEDLDIFRRCVYQQERRGMAFSFIAGVLAGVLAPFKQTSAIGKKTCTGIVVYFISSFVHRSIAVTDCSNQFCHMVRNKLNDDEGKVATLGNEDSSNFTLGGQEESSESENLVNKKYVTYEELRMSDKTQLKQGFNEPEESGQREFKATTPQPRRRTNIYGDVLE